ncbi:class I SAM-dependent methyltransferase [Paraflavitalea sp. CAU 1676]|uniref:class I SAM-dependent methyltransferase n=1 Tax=Paraflavitalea sp. CAU 1676 TaxID=3032598 RepID=UPI0023DB74E3|nr:class I SAM-dependent methyltransferase [Paraflavitalea sp. CAU 1676]
MERIKPESLLADEVTGRETLHLHLERYHFAGKHLLPGLVADVACGVGYGSYLLATEYGKGDCSIIAGDIDDASIRYAQEAYSHPSIRFVQADAYSFEAGALLNNIVSLETIEHLAEPEQFVRHMAGQLAKGGRFIASAPITPSMDANPYHLQDFTGKSFRQLFFDAGFREVASFVQVQRFNPLPLLNRKEKRSKDLRRNVLRYYADHPNKLLLRLRSIVKDGFANKYLVAVFEKL